MARRFKTKFTNKEIYTYFISESLTVRQLKSLIRSFTENANKIPYKDSFQMEELREEIIDYTGVSKYERVRGRKREIIGYGFSDKTKSQLLEQAKMLQSYVREYYDTYTSKKSKRTQKSKKAYKSFKENYGDDNTTYDFYEQMMLAMASIADIINEFGSDVVVSMMLDFKDRMHPMRIAELARQVYNKAVGKGKTAKDLADDLLDAVLDELSS